MKRIIFLIFGIVTIALANAQCIEEEIEELINFQIIASENQSNSNLAFIRQAGSENEIISIQQNQSLSSNQIYSEQLGNRNLGYIEQTGDSHISIMQQRGNGNEANIWSEGSLSLSIVKQAGSENIINSYIDNQGFLPKTVLLQQNGNNNSIDFALLGNGILWDSWPKAAYLKQNGSNLGITAIFDSYQSPFYIEQQSGVGGGMNINVSTSAFSFPMKQF